MPEEPLTSAYWQQRYLDGKTGWDRGQSHPALIEWLERPDATPCRIVVPGCGRGHEVIQLSAAGFQVTAVDYAAAPIAHVRSQLDDLGLTANLLQADVLTASLTDQFDAVYEQTCLCALQPGQRTAYADQLFRWLVPGGRLLAMFMQTGQPDGPPFDCDLASMRVLFSESRWTWPEQTPKRFDHPSGSVFEYSVSLVRRST